METASSDLFGVCSRFLVNGLVERTSPHSSQPWSLETGADSILLVGIEPIVEILVASREPSESSVGAHPFALCSCGALN
jgi:hypothetical protein